MGKIVKFCSSCDEGFAEKFGFCPNCGAALQAFEMNPLAAAAPPVEEPVVHEMAAPVLAEVLAAPPAEVHVETVAAEAAPEYAEESILEIDEPAAEPEMIAEAPEVIEISEPEPVVESVREVTAPAVSAAPTYVQTSPIDVDRKQSPLIATPIDDAFHVTIVEEKNVGQRRVLLVGAFGFMMFALMTGLVYNLFSKDLEVGSINGDDIFNAVIVEDVPTITEEEVVKKNKDDGGGGGGGGRDEKEEVTQGDLADQSKNPTRPPDAKVFRSDNFELKMPPPQTEGNKTFEKKFDRWGDPNGRFASFSNGTGTGGGQGSGTGTGQGSGRGTGAGSGTGSGYGGGLGNGNGNGTGDGDGDGGPPPEIKKGVTQGLKILSKPRPGYTDAARQNNIQGTVILRVTFLASGQVGSVSVVKGLPNGLSEQAIAAAKRISFEPAKTNGIGQSVTRQIEYSFSIY